MPNRIADDELHDWMVGIVDQIDSIDEMAGHLEWRVAALEEALVSRRARRRLVRVIRRADRAYRWVGPSFFQRRFEATVADWLLYGWQGGPAIGGRAIKRRPADLRGGR